MTEEITRPEEGPTAAQVDDIEQKAVHYGMTSLRMNEVSAKTWAAEQVKDYRAKLAFVGLPKPGDVGYKMFFPDGPPKPDAPPAEVKPETKEETAARIKAEGMSEDHPAYREAHEILHGGEPSQRKALAYLEATYGGAGGAEQAARDLVEAGFGRADIKNAILAAQAVAGRPGVELTKETHKAEMLRVAATLGPPVTMEGDAVDTSAADEEDALFNREIDLQDTFGLDVMKGWVTEFQKTGAAKEMVATMNPTQQRIKLLALFEADMSRRGVKPRRK